MLIMSKQQDGSIDEVDMRTELRGRFIVSEPGGLCGCVSGDTGPRGHGMGIRCKGGLGSKRRQRGRPHVLSPSLPM